jgi:hypothetical protein
MENMMSCHSLDEVGLVNAFIDNFNTQFVTTSTYSSIADLHTLQITAKRAKSFHPAVSSLDVSW